MKTNFNLVMILISFCLAVMSCAHNPKNEVDLEEVRKAKNEIIKSGKIIGKYKDSDIINVYNALTSLDTIELNPDDRKNETPFSVFFKTTDLKAVKSYIQSRNRAWVFDPDILKSFQAIDKLAGREIDGEIDGANIGAVIWEIGKAYPQYQTEIARQYQMPFEEAKNGILFLNSNKMPLASEIVAQKKFNDIVLLTTMAHEVTHSACVQSEKLKPLTNKSSKKEYADHDQCFSLHVECKNSDSKVLGCDQELWGPYTVNFIVLSEVAQRCVGCGLINLYIESFKSILRVNALPDKIRKEINEVFSLLTPGLTGETRKKVLFKIGRTYAGIEHYLMEHRK